MLWFIYPMHSALWTCNKTYCLQISIMLQIKARDANLKQHRSRSIVPEGATKSHKKHGKYGKTMIIAYVIEATLLFR